MPGVAVFARNHLQYLEGAAALAERDPSRLVTFRSAKRWTRAKEALDLQKTLQLYLAPIGSKGTVEYEATLHTLVLEPTKGEAETERWLTQSLPDTATEGLWEDKSGSVKTLYIISHCHRLGSPFPITTLRKESDGVPVSADYGYSYAVVLEREPATADELHPEELADPTQYFEGAVRTVAVNAYERNRAARAKCTNHYGTGCVVCGFDFGVTYGDIGEGFIHVHHLKPLSTIKQGYEVNPIVDLRPVCANCHAMLHRRMPPYSIEELTERYAGGRAAAG
jgi:hypothetical protein